MTVGNPLWFGQEDKVANEVNRTLKRGGILMRDFEHIFPDDQVYSIPLSGGFIEKYSCVSIGSLEYTCFQKP
jgi:hypothetical protein